MISSSNLAPAFSVSPGGFVVAPNRTSEHRNEPHATQPKIDIQTLHLINGEHFSGAERVQQLLGQSLPEMGVGAHFACLKPGKFPELCGLDASQVTCLEMKGRMDFSILRRVAKHAESIQADVLHAHTPRTAMIAGLVSRRTGIPWVYHVHSPTARDSTRATINRINDWVEAYSLRNANHIVTVSKSLRREMLRRGYSRHRITAIANGVAEQTPINPSERRNQDHWRLGMVALVRPRKGIEILLEAIAAMGPDRSRITLDVIGGFETPHYEASVRSLIVKLGLQETVHLRGFTKDVPSIMRTLDAMVLPSLFGEGMPMVVLEALACGVPVIATRVEGTPEVVRHAKEGILAKPQDSESLTKAIIQFISSRKAWERMSVNAVLRHRDGFSDKNMARCTARVYRRLRLKNPVR